LTIHLTNKTLAYVPPLLNPNSIEVFNAVISMTGGSLLLVKLKVKVSFIMKNEGALIIGTDGICISVACNVSFLLLVHVYNHCWIYTVAEIQGLFALKEI
jgi:hypothetical protein